MSVDNLTSNFTTTVSQREAKPSIFALLQGNQALLCSLVLLVCALIPRPFVEMGFADEFTYIRSALHLAQTGHVAYFGWGSPMLGWQLYLGALFIKILGFSFTVVRFSGLTVSVATVFLLHRILIRCGISETNASVGTLTLVLSPLFLPLAFSFMTDVPGLFSLLLCLYLCIRSVQAATDTSALNWLFFAAVSNVLSGTVRQTSWLGVIVIIPSALWLLRERPISRVKGCLLWIISLACTYAFNRWFQHQPYVEPISLMQDIHARRPPLVVMNYVSSFLLGIPLFLLPLLVGFITPVWVRTRKSRVAVLIAITILAAMVLVGFYLYFNSPGLGWLAPWGSNYVTQYGLIKVPDLGARPVVLGPLLRIIVTFLVFVAVLAFAACISSSAGPRRSETSQKSQFLSDRELAFLLAPVTMVYFGLLLPRGAVGLMFDRYLLPLLVVALILILRLYQQKVAARLPVLSFVCLLLCAGYSMTLMHDLFTMERARLAAIDELRAAGIARTAFYGGIEYDGWTQIDNWGYVPSSVMNLPPGPHPTPSWNPSSESCHYMFAPRFVAIQPSYALSFDSVACDGPSRFASVEYHTWLPPYDGAIYVQKVSVAESKVPYTTGMAVTKAQ